MMVRSFFRSIRTRLYALVLLAALPGFLIILYSGFDRLDRDTAAAKRDAMRVMQSFALQHDSSVESIQLFLKTIAKLPEVKDQDTPACNKLFAALLKENPYYSSILAATARGEIFAGSSAFAPFNISNRQYFRDMLRTKECVMGRLVMGSVTNRPVFPVACPVKDTSGRIKGAVITAYDLVRYGGVFEKIKLPKDSVLSMTDRDGTRMYRHPYPERYIARKDLQEMIGQMSIGPAEGTFASVGADGVRRLYAYKRFYLQGDPSPYLFMRVGIPEKQSLLPARKNFFNNMALLFGAFTLALLLAWLLGNVTIMSSLNKLVASSLRLAEGDLATRSGLSSKEGEIGILARAFDGMAETMEKKESVRKMAEQRLMESEERYRTAIEFSNDGVALVREGRHLYVNRKFLEIFGYDRPDEVLGQAHVLTVHPDDLDMVEEYHRKRLEGENKAPSRYEFKGIRKNGETIFIEVSVAQLIYNGESVSLAYFRDVTKHKELMEKLHTMSTIDELTGLYNRRGFITMAGQQLKIETRAGRQMLFFFADLDNMKKINDTLGHHEGDRALFDTAVILKETFRQSDIVGRMGGDEFAALAIDTSEETHRALLQRLQNNIEAFNSFPDRPYKLSLSIGVSRFDPGAPCSLEELMAQADVLMYEEKKKRKQS